MTLEVSSLSLSYRYGQSAQSTLPVQYRYGQKTAETNTLDVVHRVGTDAESLRWGRQAGFWAWSTSEIAGYFPRWHMARHSVGGRTQQLINTWGMGMDQVKQEFARFRKNLFLSTAETEQPDRFGHGDVMDFTSRQRVRKNLLLNPSFAYRGLARRNRPIYWSSYGAGSTGTATLVRTPTFIGTHALRLHTATGERVHVSQERVLPIPVGTPLTASAWYLVPSSTDYLTSDTHRAGMYLLVIYADGTATLSRAAFDLGTDGVWKRAHVSLANTKEIFAVRVGFVIENDTAANIRVYLGATQLEASSSPTTWMDNPELFLPYLTEALVLPHFDAYLQEDSVTVQEEVNTGDSVSFTSAKRRTLFPVRTYHQLWEDAVPTFATTSAAPATVPTAVQRRSLGWYQTVEGERFTTGWRIANNKIEQYNLEIPTEVAATFDVAEFWLDDRGTDDVGVLSSTEDSSFSRTLEDLCVFRNRLWLVCKETENGVTHRVLKVLNPHSRYPLLAVEEEGIENVHLECIGDVDLGFTTGTVDFVAPTEADPDQFLIRVAGTYYTVDLEYDFYTLETRRRQAILRHTYDGTLATI